MVLIIARSLLQSDSVRHHFSSPSLFIAEAPAWEGTAYVPSSVHTICHTHDHLKSHALFDICSSVMKWLKQALAELQMHLASCIFCYSSEFIVTANYLRLSINSGVEAKCHIQRSHQLWSFYIIISDCIDFTYIRALHMYICVMFFFSPSVSDFGQCLGESQPARWRAPPHRSLRCPPGSRGGQLHSECLARRPVVGFSQPAFHI